MLSFASDKQYVKYGNITRGFYASGEKRWKKVLWNKNYLQLLKITVTSFDIWDFWQLRVEVMSIEYYILRHHRIMSSCCHVLSAFILALRLGWQRMSYKCVRHTPHISPPSWNMRECALCVWMLPNIFIMLNYEIILKYVLRNKCETNEFHIPDMIYTQTGCRSQRGHLGSRPCSSCVNLVV